MKLSDTFINNAAKMAAALTCAAIYAVLVWALLWALGFYSQKDPTLQHAVNICSEHVNVHRLPGWEDGWEVCDTIEQRWHKANNQTLERDHQLVEDAAK